MTRDELRQQFGRLTNKWLRPPHSDPVKWMTEMLAAADQYAAHVAEETARRPDNWPPKPVRGRTS